MTCSRVGVRSRGLSDVLASRGASRHARRRPTMRDERRGGGVGTAPAASRTAPGTRPADPDSPDAPGDDPSGPSRPTPAPQHPQRPPASHPEDALGRPRNNPPDEEDPPEQTTTTTPTTHAFKTTLNNLPHRHGQNPADFRASAGRSRDGPGPAQASPGLRNASPARRSPPRLAPCEPSATESACARLLRARLAKCEPW